MVEIDVECVKCGKVFTFDTKGQKEEIYKEAEERLRVFHGYCPYCGELNRIELSSSLGEE
jgi:hypothetical protein